MSDEQMSATELHNFYTEAMHGEHERTGRYIDPVTRKEFPEGKHLVRNPNRAQRRRLKQWRGGA